MDGQTYKIVRFWQDDRGSEATKYEGLSLEEAQEHCRADYSKGDDDGVEWFDGYTAE